MRIPLASIVVLLVTTAGCANEPRDEPHVLRPGLATGATEDAIKGGYTDPSDTATVGIYNFNVGALCSGSLIAPNMVLTAHHCVADTSSDYVICGQSSFGPTWAASGFAVSTVTNLFSQEAQNNFQTVREVVTLDKGDFCGNDMAILILDDVVPPSEATPLVPRVDSALLPGEEYYAIGYGETDDGAGDAGLRRRRDTLFVDCAETGCNEQGVTETEWVGDQGICSGDSGGPALDLQNRVVGVTSRGAAGCYYPVYGAVHGWGQWVKDNALHAAELGGYTAPAWAYGVPTDPGYVDPTGQACTDPTQCSSGICWYGEYCSRECNDVFACPEGFACTAEADFGGKTLCTRVEAPIAPTSASDGGGGGGDGDGDGDGGDDEASAASGSSDSDSGGCTMTGRDPVTPVPWVVGLALAGVAVARRRRR